MNKDFNPFEGVSPTKSLRTQIVIGLEPMEPKHAPAVVRDLQTAEVDKPLCSKKGGPPKIGLFDHMGHGNMGDAAVHESFIHNVKLRIPGVRLIAFSQNPLDTADRHNLHSYPIRWRERDWTDSPAHMAANKPGYSNAKSILRSRCPTLYRGAKFVLDMLRRARHIFDSYKVLRSLDLLVIAGGGQLCDLWHDMPYNVWKFCFLSRLARTRVVMVGVGADQLRSMSSRLFARWAIELATYTSFRDRESQTLARSVGVRKATNVCPDPAYGLALPHQIRSQLAKPSNRRVGLNPMGYCDPRLWPRKDDTVYQHYLDKLTHFTRRLLARGYSVELFTSDIGVDKYALEDLHSRLLGTVDPAHSPNLTCYAALDLNGLLTQMTRFDVVITSKFHGVIFSNMLQKPVIALSYLPKIMHLMRSQGLETYCMEIEEFEGGSLMEKFEMLIVNSDDIADRSLLVTNGQRCAVAAEFDRVFVNLVSQVGLGRGSVAATFSNA